MNQPAEDHNKIRIGITIGDINGVGPEIIIKVFSDNRMLQLCTPVIYGSSKVLSFYRKLLHAKEFNFNSVQNAGEARKRKVNLVNCWNEEVKVQPGEPTPDGGKYAFTALQQACKDLSENRIDALVTGPIDKKTMQQEGFRFPGHTEYLAQQFESPDHLMVLVSDDLRVATVTGHIPLSDVPSHLTSDMILSKIRILNKSLQRDFGIRKPRIAVLGLNPHSGDQGLLGKEEEEIIKPAIVNGADQGLLVFGPYSADGFFGSKQYSSFDGVIAMYHDQGLIPFKSISFDSGVNFTAGLPVVRTSPDHGTAYDIAGKGIASEHSLRSAIFTGCDIVNSRKEHDSLVRDQLKYSKLGEDR